MNWGLARATAVVRQRAVRAGRPGRWASPPRCSVRAWGPGVSSGLARVHRRPPGVQTRESPGAGRGLCGCSRRCIAARPRHTVTRKGLTPGFVRPARRRGRAPGMGARADPASCSTLASGQAVVNQRRWTAAYVRALCRDDQSSWGLGATSRLRRLRRPDTSSRALAGPAAGYGRG